jgi:hypothetical protein
MMRCETPTDSDLFHPSANRPLSGGWRPGVSHGVGKCGDNGIADLNSTAHIMTVGATQVFQWNVSLPRTSDSMLGNTKIVESEIGKSTAD